MKSCSSAPLEISDYVLGEYWRLLPDQYDLGMEDREAAIRHIRAIHAALAKG